jgi:hypothetical protein
MPPLLSIRRHARNATTTLNAKYGLLISLTRRNARGRTSWALHALQDEPNLLQLP